MEEKTLVTLAKSGDQKAFVTLYACYKQRLYRYAYYRLGNPEDAEDAVSDCILQAWAGIGSLKKAEAFSPWLFRILYCSCTAIIKAQAMRRQMKSIDDSEYDLVGTMDSTVEKTELLEALNRLKEAEREVVLLSVIMGFNSREIARITDSTPTAVRSRLSRSLKKMRTFMEGITNEKEGF